MDTRDPAHSVTLVEYWAVLRRRRWLAAGAAAAVVVLTVVYTFVQPRVYRATTTLIVEPDIPELASFTGNTPLALTRQFYETQYAVIRSDSVLSRALQAAGLDRDPAFAEAPKPAEALRRLVSVEPVPDSRIVRIGADHTDPRTAAAVANAVARVYIAHNMEDRRAASRNAFEGLSQQLESLQVKVEESERALLEYRGQEDILSLERRQTLLEEKLARLGDGHNQAVARAAELDNVLREVEELRRRPELVESLPRDLDTPLVQKLKGELAELNVALARISGKYKAKHPDVLALESQIKNVRGRLADEAEKIYRSLEIERRLARAREEAARESLEQAQQESARLAEQAIRYNVLQRETESNRQMYDVLLQRLREADVGGAVSGQNVRVLDPAAVPPEPYRPRTSVNLLLGLLAGLLAGLGLAFLAEHVDNTVKNEEDVTQLLGRPLLGLIPRQRGRVQVAGGRSDPLSLAYDALRTSLRLYARDHRLQTVLVTSAVRAEGKTLSAVSLATVFARSGVRTLLVDADMFQCVIAKRMRMSQQVGLADYFFGGARLEDVVRPSRVPNLDVVPAGLAPAKPAEPLGSGRMQGLLEEARQRWAMVIVDSPPVTAALDVAMLSSLVDGVVFVVRAASTRRSLARKVLAQLDAARGNVLGVLLTWAEVAPDTLGSYYYYREYHKTEA